MEQSVVLPATSDPAKIPSKDGNGSLLDLSIPPGRESALDDPSSDLPPERAAPVEEPVGGQAYLPEPEVINFFSPASPPESLIDQGFERFIPETVHPAPDSVLTSGHGYRRHPIHGDWRLHRGADFGAAVGSPIVAFRDGVVHSVVDVSSGAYGGQGYGDTVILSHPDGIFSRYHHLHQVFVQPGQPVRAGDQIATMGSTGQSTGSHLDFEIRLWSHNGEAVDPAPYLNGAGPAVTTLADTETNNYRTVIDHLAHSNEVRLLPGAEGPATAMFNRWMNHWNQNVNPNPVASIPVFDGYSPATVAVVQAFRDHYGLPQRQAADAPFLQTLRAALFDEPYADTSPEILASVASADGRTDYQQYLEPAQPTVIAAGPPPSPDSVELPLEEEPPVASAAVTRDLPTLAGEVSELTADGAGMVLAFAHSADDSTTLPAIRDGLIAVLEQQYPDSVQLQALREESGQQRALSSAVMDGIQLFRQSRLDLNERQLINGQAGFTQADRDVLAAALKELNLADNL